MLDGVPLRRTFNANISAAIKRADTRKSMARNFARVHSGKYIEMNLAAIRLMYYRRLHRWSISGLSASRRAQSLAITLPLCPLNHRPIERICKAESARASVRASERAGDSVTTRARSVPRLIRSLTSERYHG